MRLLSLAAVARQLGVCPKTAKKIITGIPAAVDVNGHTMYRYDVLTDFITRGGCRPAERPAA